MKDSKENLNELERRAILIAENFGTAEDVFHPEYGYILRNGKPTEKMIEWYIAYQEDSNENQSI